MARKREEPFETIKDCAKLAMLDSVGRCNVADIKGKSMELCVNAQGAALDDLELEITNYSEDVYREGPFSKDYPKAKKLSLEFGEFQCERAFHPNAEDELAEIRRPPKNNEAKEIAHMLFEPFLEQFVEIPREQRIEATQKCQRIVRKAIEEMDKCLRERWPRRK